LIRYKHYLAVVRKRKPNGYYQDVATIRKFWRIAVAKGEAKMNPFANFDFDKEETHRNWHPKDELLKLYEILKMDKFSDEQISTIKASLAQPKITPEERRHLDYFLKTNGISAAVKSTLRHYLFSCFSGLRFGDKKSFSNEEIVNDRIQLRQGKTGKLVTIPFNDQARELLPFILAQPLQTNNNRVNTELQVCMYVAKVNKHITFHCSRHTFAINCILVGIDIIAVRDWLGHKSVKTTEIYVKIAEEYRNENMKKFDNFFTGKIAS